MTILILSNRYLDSYFPLSRNSSNRAILEILQANDLGDSDCILPLHLAHNDQIEKIQVNPSILKAIVAAEKTCSLRSAILPPKRIDLLKHLHSLHLTKEDFIMLPIANSQGEVFAYYPIIPSLLEKMVAIDDQPKSKEIHTTVKKINEKWAKPQQKIQYNPKLPSISEEEEKSPTS